MKSFSRAGFASSFPGIGLGISISGAQREADSSGFAQSIGPSTPVKNRRSIDLPPAPQKSMGNHPEEKANNPYTINNPIGVSTPERKPRNNVLPQAPQKLKENNRFANKGRPDGAVGMVNARTSPPVQQGNRNTASRNYLATVSTKGAKLRLLKNETPFPLALDVAPKEYLPFSPAGEE